MRWCLVAVALCACGSDEPDVVSTFDALPACELGVAELLTLDLMMPPGADSEGFAPADEATRAGLARSIAAVAVDDGDATLAGYAVCADGEVAVWMPAPGSGRPALAWRRGDAREVILEAPHPVFDTDTLRQSVAVFELVEARALVASGTHRCANAAPAGCDGTTSACGTSAPYRVSDMAHTVDSEFDAAHRALSDAFASDVVISVHGFADDGASVSDGTQRDTTADSPSARLATALADRLPNERITSCNAFAGAEVDQRLCGTTNVQGRYLNGSADACTESAPASSGRFIHVEQSRTLREDPTHLAGAIIDAL